MLLGASCTGSLLFYLGSCIGTVSYIAYSVVTSRTAIVQRYTVACGIWDLGRCGRSRYLYIQLQKYLHSSLNVFLGLFTGKRMPDKKRLCTGMPPKIVVE